MGVVNYEKLLSELIKPLVSRPEDVEILIVEETEKNIKLKVTVDPDDLGRIIGRKGRIANAIRTIVHAAAVRDDMRIDIDLASEQVEEQE